RIERVLEVALGQRAALDQRLGALRLAPRQRQGRFGRLHRDLGGADGVGQIACRDARQLFALLDGLALFARRALERTANLGANGGLAAGRELPGNDRARAQFHHAGDRDVLAADLDGRGLGWLARLVGAAPGGADR